MMLLNMPQFASSCYSVSLDPNVFFATVLPSNLRPSFKLVHNMWRIVHRLPVKFQDCL
jgi:hypothetical protein